MKRKIAVALLVAALPFLPRVLWADETDPNLGHFLENFRDGWKLAKLGRTLEAQSLLEAQVEPLGTLSPANRRRYGEKLARALEYIQSTEAAGRTRALMALADRKEADEAAKPQRLGTLQPKVASASDLSWVDDMLGLSRDPRLAEETQQSTLDETMKFLRTVQPTGVVLVKRAECFIGLNKLNDAAAELEAAGKLGEHSASVQMTLARLEWKRGSAARAGKVLGENPALMNRPEATSLLAQICEQSVREGRRLEATTLCGALLTGKSDLVESDPLLAGLTAGALESKGQTDIAFGLYVRSVQGNAGPEVVEGLVRTARAIAQRGSVDRQHVIDQLGPVVRPSMRTPAPLLAVMADLLLEEGRTNGAKQYAKVGLRTKSPELFRPILDRIGSTTGTDTVEVAERTGQRISASDAFEEAIEKQATALATFVVKQRDSSLDEAVAVAVSGSFDIMQIVQAGLSARSDDDVPQWLLSGRSPEEILEESKQPVAIHRPLAHRRRGVRYMHPSFTPNRTRVFRGLLEGDVQPAIDVLSQAVGWRRSSWRNYNTWPTSRIRNSTAGTMLIQPRSLEDTGDGQTPPRTLEPETPPSTQEPETPPRTQTPAPVTPPRTVDPVTLPPQEPEEPPLTRLVRRSLQVLQDEPATEIEKIARTMEGSQVIGSPILIDVDNIGRPELTADGDADRAVWFDLLGTGRPQKVQWTAGGRQGWLCEDLSGSGMITSGLELFGTAGGFSSGYEKLALRDRNHDGQVSGAELAGLSLWFDRNSDGISQPGELVSVATAGIETIRIPVTGMQSTVLLHGQVRTCWDVWPQIFGLARR